MAHFWLMSAWMAAISGAANEVPPKPLQVVVEAEGIGRVRAGRGALRA